MSKSADSKLRRWAIVIAESRNMDSTKVYKDLKRFHNKTPANRKFAAIKSSMDEMLVKFGYRDLDWDKYHRKDS